MPVKPKPKTKMKIKTKAKTKTKAKKDSKPKAKAALKKKAAPAKKIKAGAKSGRSPKAKAEPKAKPGAKTPVKPKPKAAAEPKAKKVLAVEDEKERKERLRKLLIRRREEIIREAKSEIKKFTTGENKQLVETVMDDGDMSVVDMSEDISLKQLSTHRETLMKIDLALRKLEEGTYGICEECGDEISEERLKVLPFAVYCRDDQEKKEMMEKLEKE